MIFIELNVVFDFYAFYMEIDYYYKLRSYYYLVIVLITK